MPIPRFLPRQTALLVVDVQEKLLPVMHEPQYLVQQVARLIDGAKVLQLPIIVTEQYRKGLGSTVPELAARLGTSPVLEKMKFSACLESVRDILQQHNLRSVIVCGIEAHVCVLQTCLDLTAQGYLTALAVDAISSRRPQDATVAITRMTQVGIVPTTVESILLEMVHEAGTATFKAMLPIIKP